MHNAKLIQYTLLGSCYLLGSKFVQGEIVYTDIDPDIIINDDNEAFGIDIDGNGSFDFAFLKAMWSGSTYYSSDRFFITQLWCGPYVSENEIAALTLTIGSAASTTFTQQFPYALNAGSLINESLSFSNEGYQLLAARMLDYYGNLADWAGKWWPVTEDKFLGVKFTDMDDIQHFGWIRCSVLDSTEILVIKDMAYESLQEVEISAGDTVSAEGPAFMQEEHLMLHLFVFDHVLHISIGESKEKSLIHIYTLSGQQVYAGEFSGSEAQIHLWNLPSGVYMASVETDGFTQTLKFEFIN